MKINKVKLIFAILLSILGGFVFEIIATPEGFRNWISLGVGFISLLIGLVPAIAIDFENRRRAVSIKVFAWLLVSILFVCNVLFAFFAYRIDVYIVTSLSIAILGCFIVYAITKLK